MKQLNTQKQSYTCGLHVAGHGLEISPPGKAIPWRKDIVFENGVIVMVPDKRGGPYTVFDIKTFSVIEVREEHLSLKKPTAVGSLP